MLNRFVGLLALVASCSPPAPAPVMPTPVGPAGRAPATPIDAPAASQDEKLAAIQHAMNQLDEAAQGCWAAAATDRFDIEGELTVLVDISATDAKTQVTSDTARNGKLAACLAQLLASYKWAPPLHGQAIQLPFKFTAPGGQSVIDRRLVEWKGQVGVSVAVLLDENNSGNAAASMVEIAIAKGSSTGIRAAARAELWFFVDRADVGYGHLHGTSSAQGRPGVGRSGQHMVAGDMMFVAPGQVREVEARDADAHAVIVFLPGGREGTARAGALPTREYTITRKGAPAPKLLLARDAKTYGPATIYAELAITKDAPFSASILNLAANAVVPEHVHANETELLYLLDGRGTMTIAGQPIEITPTSVIQIPPNTKHGFTAATPVRALQVYTPAGPEQRFKQPKPKTP
jgi:quercetin dioxygenase-like cupin family protein